MVGTEHSSQFISSPGNQPHSSTQNEPFMDAYDVEQIIVPERKSWKNLFSYIGPGFLVAIAYIDPGNFETDLQSGAQYKYELLWIILVASWAALIIQSLAARLGVVTGKHLAEHCRVEYPTGTNLILWFLAEIAVVACDIPEVIGTAFALNMLFNIPVWCGVLIAGLSTMVLLLLQQYGVRKLEFLIAFLVFVMAVCFLMELGYAKPKSSEVLKGLFVPSLQSSGAIGLAISLLGAMVMPHNLFLHSALVLSRKIPRSTQGIKENNKNMEAYFVISLFLLSLLKFLQEACRFYTIESAFGLSVAFLINVSVISVSGAVCSSANLSEDDRKSCEDLNLNKASFLLKNVLGGWSSKIFAIALLASGQSSTITGTYAGQYVMQGFLNLRIRPYLRNLLTRSLAIVPSLIVALIGGSAGAGKLIIIASMILSFELPFALVPLLKFTSSHTKMGSHANSKKITVTTWIIGLLIMSINIYFIMSSFINLFIHGSLRTVPAVFVGIFGFSAMLVYLAGVIYLVFRKNTKTIQPLLSADSETCRGEEISPTEMPREDIVNLQLPRRNSTDHN